MALRVTNAEGQIVFEVDEKTSKITLNDLPIAFPETAGVNGQVLTTDGHGVTTWQDGGGGANVAKLNVPQEWTASQNFLGSISTNYISVNSDTTVINLDGVQSNAVYSGSVVQSLGDNTVLSVGNGFVMPSPDGTMWRLTVSDSGVVAAELV